jgi:hypothetical protein
MRLDHVSYAVSNNELSSTVQRIGSLLNTPFEDGGIHPEFGTRNFICPLLNGQYIEIVCPLEHPATEITPFGKAVKQKAVQGGGWLTWVIAMNDLNNIEDMLGRKSIEGHRVKPDKTNLKWRQIGVIDILDNPQLPFFIKWSSANHPSDNQKANSFIQKINLYGQKKVIESTLNFNLDSVPQVNLIETINLDNMGEIGIKSVVFETNGELIEIE